MALTFSRSLAAAAYVLAAFVWAWLMVWSRLLGCEGGNCTPDDVHRMDVSLVLGLVGFALAAGALLAAFFRRWLGLVVLASHFVVFALNLGFFWDLSDAPWTVVPAAALAAVSGYVAVGSLRPPPPSDQPSSRRR